jgi:hypothetical protein
MPNQMSYEQATSERRNQSPGHSARIFVPLPDNRRLRPERFLAPTSPNHLDTFASLSPSLTGQIQCIALLFPSLLE